ncbi:MAG: sulfatase [Phycisphaerae bacterium]|nr:sulfatase [Phycisphaerae bacterium]
MGKGSMKRIVGAMAILIVLAGALLFWREVSRRPVNVVLIVLDTVRADCVGVETKDGPLTPSIDEVARQGTKFANAFAPAPWTVPSHASLFTGLYPHEHQAVHGQFRLRESRETMAEILRSRGYKTGGFTCNPWLHRRSGMAQGFDTYEEVYKQVKNNKEKGAASATQMVTTWIGERAGEDAPFFLFVNYLEAHLPYIPPGRILDRMNVAEEAPRRRFTLGQAERTITGKSTLSPEDIVWVRTLYQAEIAYLDEQVGTLVSCLRSSGCLDDTILIITSDHGEHLGEHSLMGHEFSLCDPVLRIPLVIRYPKALAAGQSVGRPVSLVDILPTVLAILGDGELVSGSGEKHLLYAEATDESEDGGERGILAEYSRPFKLINDYWRSKYPDIDMSRYDVSLKSLRKGRFRYVLSGRGEEVLYDLAANPGEDQNVANSYPEETASLRAKLSEMVSGQESGESQRSPTETGDG